MTFPNAQNNPAGASPVYIVAGGVAVPNGDLYANVAADATIKATPGVLKSVIVNSKGTVASTITVRDGTNVIAIIDSLNLSGTFTFNVGCLTNINVVVTGTIKPNLTVTYQ